MPPQPVLQRRTLHSSHSSHMHRRADTEFVNLNFEVDYDNGKSFRNSEIAWSAAKMVMGRSGGMVKRVVGMLKKHRPAYCLCFWEPSVATILNVLNCPTKLVSIASQGMIFADKGGGQQGQGLIMRGARGSPPRPKATPHRTAASPPAAPHVLHAAVAGMHVLNVGKKGTLVPLSVREIPGAIPQIVQIPQRKAPGDELGDFYVAYTTAPQARAAPMPRS